jgi:hypothetical protein
MTWVWPRRLNLRTLRSSREDTGLQAGVVLVASLSHSTQGEDRLGGGLRLRRPLSGVLEEDSSSRTLQLGLGLTSTGGRVGGGLSSMEGEKQALGLRLRRPLSSVLEADSSSTIL